MSRKYSKSKRKTYLFLKLKQLLIVSDRFLLAVGRFSSFQVVSCTSNLLHSQEVTGNWHNSFNKTYILGNIIFSQTFNVEAALSRISALFYFLFLQ